jgi:3-hydroxyacyl-CoA dehydrogenase
VVAVIGAGVIGRSWALVFARGGCLTRIYDQEPSQAERARAWVEDSLAQDVRDGAIAADAASRYLTRIAVVRDLGEALTGAEYVQESAPEDLPIKRSLYARLDELAEPDGLLASSTSTFDMSEIAIRLRGASRCVVAHPVNPPHQLPLVEILGGRHTSSQAIARASAFLTSVGQRPVVLDRFVKGFVLNRLQFALVREAMHLVRTGVASVDAVDTVVREGLGPRWALLGPFGVADTNHDDGIRGYYMGHEQLVMDLMDDLGPTPHIDEALIAQLGDGTDAMRGSAPRVATRRWRDRMLRKLRLLKDDDPPPATLG